MILKELFEDALPIISKFAPSIGGAIGGPFGFAAGYALPLLANAFGTNPKSLKSLVEAINLDPKASEKLAALEDEHGNWIHELMLNMHNLAKAEVNIKLEWSDHSSIS